MGNGMLTARALLDEARAAGVEVEAAGDKLRLRAKAKPDDGLIERIKAHKFELIGFLQKPKAQPEALRPADPVREWRAAIESVTPPDQDGEHLQRASLDFLNSELASNALMLGWNEVHLFGVHKGPKPNMRGDASGLIPSLAWSALGLILIALDAEHAFLRSEGGSALRHPRRQANHDRLRHGGCMLLSRNKTDLANAEASTKAAMQIAALLHFCHINRRGITCLLVKDQSLSPAGVLCRRPPRNLSRPMNSAT